MERIKTLTILFDVVLHMTCTLPAYDSCSKPCTDVTYSFSAEPFTALTAPELVLVSQCDWTDRPSLITIQFSRRVTVEYVSKANREGFKNSSSID